MPGLPQAGRYHLPGRAPQLHLGGAVRRGDGGWAAADEPRRQLPVAGGRPTGAGGARAAAAAAGSRSISAPFFYRTASKIFAMVSWPTRSPS